jgi:hypothetical protein
LRLSFENPSPRQSFSIHATPLEPKADGFQRPAPRRPWRRWTSLPAPLAAGGSQRSDLTITLPAPGWTLLSMRVRYRDDPTSYRQQYAVNVARKPSIALIRCRITPSPSRERAACGRALAR